MNVSSLPPTKWPWLSLTVFLLALGCQPSAPDENTSSSSHTPQSSATEQIPAPQEGISAGHSLSEQGTHEPEHEDHEVIRLDPEALQGQSFQTAVVERRPIREEIQATATIQPNAYKLTHVSPRIEGKAVQVFAKLGDHVQAGQVLAILDSIELGYKKSAFRQARTMLLVNKANYEREKRLFKQQISSEKDYLDAKGAYLESLAAYQAAFEALELMGLSHEEIEALGAKQTGHHPLSAFPLKAPQAGTVIARHITPGELITPRDKPFTIADLSTVWILLDIYEQDLAHVQVGAQVRIAVDAYPEERFHGTLTYLDNVLNPETRTVQARVEIPNPPDQEKRLRPGMFAKAWVTTSRFKQDRVLVVPRSAIQHVEGQPVVFVEERPGTYHKRAVTLGSVDGSYVEVRTGLKEGERVVTKGSFYLKSILEGEKMAGHTH
ncbi:MAG: efflux RND transporter periplasmic adaptor subunit [Nitrospirae bacterium]|nr:MAG: efflux RND transporter periplasmic adaptor subunit [Nitrospirota bacterium]